jgi:hypothetical protein
VRALGAQRRVQAPPRKAGEGSHDRDRGPGSEQIAENCLAFSRSPSRTSPAVARGAIERRAPGWATFTPAW